MTITHRTPRDAARTSRFRVSGTPARAIARLANVRVAASLLTLAAITGTTACTPATPHGANVAPTPHGSARWAVEPGDIIRLKNWGAPEQTGDLTVNERGVVLVPNVGRLTVQGLPADSLETRIVQAFNGRVDASRVDVILLRPITVSGGVKNPSVQVVDGPTSVLSLVAKAGGAIRPGGDVRVFIVRTNEATREVSLADRIGDLGVRSSDQLYVQDPPFVVRNELAIRAAYELVQFGLGLLTVYYLIRHN